MAIFTHFIELLLCLSLAAVQPSQADSATCDYIQSASTIDMVEVLALEYTDITNDYW